MSLQRLSLLSDFHNGNAKHLATCKASYTTSISGILLLLFGFIASATSIFVLVCSLAVPRGATKPNKMFGSHGLQFGRVFIIVSYTSSLAQLLRTLDFLQKVFLVLDEILVTVGTLLDAIVDPLKTLLFSVVSERPT
jgi:hypothetical protein